MNAITTDARVDKSQDERSAIKRRLWVVAVIGLTLLVTACASEPAARTGTKTAPNTASEPEVIRAQRFRTWVETFRENASRAGISHATLDAALGSVTFLPRVIELARSQPEFAMRIWAYMDTTVSQARVERGRAQMTEHARAVHNAARAYGIPPEILVAIWGMESSYGAFMGDFSTVDALATLAFAGRRRDFARRQLIAALEILDRGVIQASWMRGSWAGAMGQTQFIPTSYQQYAVDADGDGRRDIWGSVADALASAAHYLAQAGWHSGEPWGMVVRLPEGFNYALARLAVRKSTEEWAQIGVSAARGGTLPEFQAASIIVPAGARGPAFLVGHNFRVIMAYNAAVSYALAVVHLADRIGGGPDFVASWPRGLAAMSRAQIKTMQRLLNQQGFEVGAVDGIVGPNTRAGLRAFQRSNGLVADGYPTFALLQLLKESS